MAEFKLPELTITLSKITHTINLNYMLTKLYSTALSPMLNIIYKLVSVSFRKRPLHVFSFNCTYTTQYRCSKIIEIFFSETMSEYKSLLSDIIDLSDSKIFKIECLFILLWKMFVVLRIYRLWFKRE